MKAALLVAALLPLTAQADGTWLTVSGVSHHFDRSKDYNELNWGFGLERGFAKDWRAVGGFYRNSFRRDSLYVGATWTPVKLGPVRLGAVAMGVTGYTERKFLPVVLPVATLEWGRIGANVVLAPPVKELSGGIALQLKFELN